MTTTRTCKQAAFTLMELMIVITIISILIAVALPSYQKYTKRAHYIEVVQSCAPYKLAVEQCYQLYSDLSKCKSGSGGIDPPTTYNKDSLIQSITVEKSGIIHAFPKARFGIKSTDDYQLIPQSTAHGLIWHAEGNGVKNGLVTSGL